MNELFQALKFNDTEFKSDFDIHVSLFIVKMCTHSSIFHTYRCRWPSDLIYPFQHINQYDALN